MSKQKSKILAPDESEQKHQAAIRGLENLGLYDKADEIADLDPVEYAESKGYQVQNPQPNFRNRRLKTMAKTRADLLAEVQELQEENDRLSDILDSVSSLVTTDDDEDDEDDEDE